MVRKFTVIELTKRGPEVRLVTGDEAAAEAKYTEISAAGGYVILSAMTGTAFGPDFSLVPGGHYENANRRNWAN